MNNDLISKKQAINFLKTLAYEPDMSDEAATAVCMAWGGIDRMPTVDAEPVRHGRWIPMYEEVERLTAEGWRMEEVQTAWKCSWCGREEIAERDKMPYCHCGAKMDLEV